MCNDIEQMASLFIDDMLDENLKIDFLEHISTCENCRNYFDSLTLIIDDINSLEEVIPPIGLHKSIMDSINKEISSSNNTDTLEVSQNKETFQCDNKDISNVKKDSTKKAKILDFSKFSKNKYAVASILLVALISAPVLNSINLFELKNSNDKVTVMASELEDKGKILGKNEVFQKTVTLVIRKPQNDEGISYKILNDVGEKSDIISAQNSESGMIITSTVPVESAVNFANTIINSYDQVTYSVKKESVSEAMKKIEDDIALNNELKTLFLEISNDETNKEIAPKIQEKVSAIDEEISSLNSIKEELSNNYKNVTFQIFII